MIFYPWVVAMLNYPNILKANSHIKIPLVHTSNDDVISKHTVDTLLPNFGLLSHLLISKLIQVSLNYLSENWILSAKDNNNHYYQSWDGMK